MENNSTYEKLRRVINKINHPNGVPLGFGCDVIYESEDIGNGQTTLTENESKSLYIDTTSFILLKKEIKENLGPDLSLQDILRAMGIKDVFWKLIQDGSGDFLLLCGPNDNREYIAIEGQKVPKDLEEKKHLQLLDLLNG